MQALNKWSVNIVRHKGDVDVIKVGYVSLLKKACLIVNEVMCESFVKTSNSPLSDEFTTDYIFMPYVYRHFRRYEYMAARVRWEKNAQPPSNTRRNYSNIEKPRSLSNLEFLCFEKAEFSFFGHKFLLKELLPVSCLRKNRSNQYFPRDEFLSPLAVARRGARSLI
jgi:hypothetical protein